jgi:hypothetical protein
MFRLFRSRASAIPNAKTHQIEGAGHAAPFDATSNFVQLIADTVNSLHPRSSPSEQVGDGDHRVPPGLERTHYCVPSTGGG